MWDERDLRLLAASQYGLLTRSQISDVGVTDHEIKYRLASIRMHQLHPGVYYLDSVTATWRTSVLAGVMAAGPDALASHRTAAILWELDAVYGRIIEVTVPYNDGPEPDGVILHRTRRPNASTLIDSIPVTTIEKTLTDLAAFMPDKTMVKAMRSAVHRGLTSVDLLDRAVARFGGRGVGGTRRMRRVIRIVADDKSASVAEIDLREIVMNAPVPAPIQQLRIRLPDGENAYPDFAWPDRMRIVEVDGFGAHGTPEQLQHDLHRQNQLMDLGWDIRRFTATEVREEPQRVRDEVIRFVNKPVL